MPIALRRFHKDDLATYRAWFADQETARRISQPDMAWLRHVTLISNSGAWAATDAGRMLAVMQADWDSDMTAWICVVVAPSARHRGIGAEVLRALLNGFGNRFAVVEAGVEPSNVGGLKCASRCGFIPMSQEPDHEGFLHLTLARNLTIPAPGAEAS